MYVRYRDIRETMDERVVCSNNKRNGANKRAEDCSTLATIFCAKKLYGGQAPVIGLYSDYEKDEHGSYLFTAGQFVDQQVEHVIEIPASTYAKFRTRKGPIEEVVLETWQQIWAWDERHYRTYTGDFEWYDERSIDPKEAQIDIYIAVDEEMLAKTNIIS